MIVGTLTRHVDGCLSGVLRTLTIRTQIELRPEGTAAGRDAFEVMLGSGFVAGRGKAAGNEVDFSILSPELAKPLRLRAVPPAGDSDEWQVVWEAPE